MHCPLLFSLLIFLLTFSSPATAEVPSESAQLSGALFIIPSKHPSAEVNVTIQPGTPLRLKLIVENKGTHPSAAGRVFVRYVFAPPLQGEPGSLLFTSEPRPLPSLSPGEHIEILFDTPHSTPSLLDFVRDDWALREYQAIGEINGAPYVLGTAALTFSAHYYPGIRHDLIVDVPQKTPSTGMLESMGDEQRK